MGVGSSSRPEGREFQFCALQRSVHAPDLMVVMDGKVLDRVRARRRGNRVKGRKASVH